MKQKKILGHVEEVAIPSLGLYGVVAKVDTGAFSGALHCTDIALSDDEKTLSFNPLGRADLRVHVAGFKVSNVRSTSGYQEKRYLIPVSVRVQNRSYPTVIGLTDRSDMGKEMLLGRRFLREHNMLVDVTINDEHDEEWRRLHI